MKKLTESEIAMCECGAEYGDHQSGTNNCPKDDDAYGFYKDRYFVATNKFTYKYKLKTALQLVSNEVERAKTLFPANFVNQHEAYAVLLEEVDELWDEIKKNQKNYDLEAQKKEAIQAAAMLMRLVVELL